MQTLLRRRWGWTPPLLFHCLVLVFAPHQRQRIILLALPPTSKRRPVSRAAPTTTSLDGLHDHDTENDVEDDRRAFRACLVQKGVPSLPLEDGSSTATAAPPPSSSSWYAFESTPLIQVGIVLLSLPTTDLNQALANRCYHRSILLVTSVYNDDRPTPSLLVDREEEDMHEPHEWTYRGILLNQPNGLTRHRRTHSFP